MNEITVGQSVRRRAASKASRLREVGRVVKVWRAEGEPERAKVVFHAANGPVILATANLVAVAS